MLRVRYMDVMITRRMRKTLDWRIGVASDPTSSTSSSLVRRTIVLKHCTAYQEIYRSDIRNILIGLLYMLCLSWAI